MCFRIPNRSVSISDTTNNNQTAVRVVSVRDGSLYDSTAVASTSTQTAQTYLDQAAEQKANAITDESVSIKGSVTVPVATTFTESKKSINELATEKGDLAKVKDPIDLCPFLSDVPVSDLGELPNVRLGDLPSMNDILGAINGITLPTMQVVSDAITGVVGKIGDTLNDLGKGLQDSLPEFTCGKPKDTESEKRMEMLKKQGQSMGAAFANEPLIEAVPKISPPDYGAQPNIVIDSPDVTVESLSDELDAGEF